MLLKTPTTSRGLVGSSADVPLFGIFVFTWRRVSCSFLAVLSRVSATSTASLSLWMVPEVSWLRKRPFGFPTAKRCPHPNSEEHYGTLHHRVQPTLKEWRFMFPVHINYLAFYPRDWPALSCSFSNLVGAPWVMGIYRSGCLSSGHRSASIAPVSPLHSATGHPCWCSKLLQALS